MSNIRCGHFRFSVVGKWILCSDCDRGIDVNSKDGQRILERARGEKKLDPMVQATYSSLVESYKQLVERAGTTDPSVLADYANGRGVND